MKATTIKLDGDLLHEVETIKPKTQSVTGYVRDVLRKEFQRHRMAAAASRYNAFLAAHPEEQAWMAEWDRADLANPPKRRK